MSHKIRHRDRARRDEEADPRDRREARNPGEDLLPYGHDKAKVSQSFIAGLEGRKRGKLCS
jgi:hypothetical protein